MKLSVTARVTVLRKLLLRNIFIQFLCIFVMKWHDFSKVAALSYKYPTFQLWIRERSEGVNIFARLTIPGSFFSLIFWITSVVSKILTTFIWIQNYMFCVANNTKYFMIICYHYSENCLRLSLSINTYTEIHITKLNWCVCLFCQNTNIIFSW